jgi:hypothetical protein
VDSQVNHEPLLLFAWKAQTDNTHRYEAALMLLTFALLVKHHGDGMSH